MFVSTFHTLSWFCCINNTVDSRQQTHNITNGGKHSQLSILVVPHVPWSNSQKQTVVSSTCFIGKTSKEGRKEMFYLTMHLTHFVYGYMASEENFEIFPKTLPFTLNLVYKLAKGSGFLTEIVSRRIELTWLY